MSERMPTRPILNLDDVEFQSRPPAFAATGDAAQRFDARMGVVGARIGAKGLGYNITAVPPGKRAFPLHNHMVNEEMFFILEGRGELRLGDATHPVRAGDFIACPAGGRETAHQLVNTGDGELKYLAVSTALSPELCQYPDSDKFAVSVYGESARPGDWRFRYVGREEDARGYWEGE